MVQSIKLEKRMSDKVVESLASTFLNENSYDILVEQDCDGFDVYGEPVFKFRKNILNHNKLVDAVSGLEDAINFTDQRAFAAGGKTDVHPNGFSKTKEVLSSIVGFDDATGVNKFCRKTAFTKNFFEKYKKALPLIEEVDHWFSFLLPRRHKKQKMIADATDRNYVIQNTSFSTVTCNKNFQTAVHTDRGDFKPGFGNLIVYRRKEFKGCYFCLPQFKIAIDLKNCDLLLVDVHHWHGNTSIVPVDNDYERFSFIMYYREKMIKCDSPSIELLKRKQIETINLLSSNFYKLRNDKIKCQQRFLKTGDSGSKIGSSVPRKTKD